MSRLSVLNMLILLIIDYAEELPNESVEKVRFEIPIGKILYHQSAC